MTKQTTEVKPAEMRTDHREQRGKDVFVVPLSRITVQEDFNKRADDNYGDIDELSESIKAVGQIQHGFGHRNADGTWVLTAGHRRFAALHRIAEATGKEQTMLLMKAPKDNVTRLVIQYVENVKHPNSEWDRALIIKGLLDEGLKPKEVIAKLGIPQPTFYALKNLLDTAPEVQQALKNGEVSGTTVNKMVASLKDKGEKLAAAVKEATAKAKAEGKTKATDKHTNVAGTRTPQTIMKQTVAKLQGKAEEAKLSKNEAFALALFSKVLDKYSDRTLADLIRNGAK